ncbi:MAG: T9SS type A sorting domain-containing protein, partial [Bacteroidia bacterium]|nr:T9SS type A sorting domain-containing protein [Bacteroidia bacterium]
PLNGASLTLENQLGQKVKEMQNLKGNAITLYRDNLPCGVYFIRLTQGNKIIATQKIAITD